MLYCDVVHHNEFVDVSRGVPSFLEWGRMEPPDLGHTRVQPVTLSSVALRFYNICILWYIQFAYVHFPYLELSGCSVQLNFNLLTSDSDDALRLVHIRGALSW